jgi:hypothetical protein
MAEDNGGHVPELFSFAEHFASLGTLSESASGSAVAASEALRKQVEGFSAVFKAIARDAARSYPQMEAASDRLADLGWTVPMLVTPRTFVALADPSYSDSDIEAMLSDFYTDLDCEQLRIVQQKVIGAPLFGRWRGLLDEAFEAFYAGRSQIPVPALLAVTEGALAAESGALSISVRAIVAGRQSQETAQSLEAMVWRSVRRWVDHLFAYYHFSGPQPSALNRHWILHGRDAGPWTKTDVVRLFAALHTLAFK